MEQENDQSTKQPFQERAYYTGSDELTDYVFDAVAAKLRGNSDRLELCDLGGGRGHVLRTLSRLLSDVGPDLANRIHMVLTSLTEYINPRRLPSYIHEYREASIELPPADFRGRFDVIVAQNSVFFWSSAPELAARNIHRMLKPGGIAIVNFPIDGIDEVNPNFDPLDFFETSPLFNVLKWDTFANGTTVIVLEKRIGAIENDTAEEEFYWEEDFKE